MTGRIVSNTRQSNIELCRIIAMLMIVAGHLTQQSGILHRGGVNYKWAVILGSGSGIADNIFVMIGAYFLVDLSFQSQRIIKLYAEVWTYCVPITIFMTVLFPEYVGIKEFVRGLFVYSGSPLWFASCYISMLIVTPFLNRLLIYQKASKVIILLLFFINVIPSTFLLRGDFFYSGEVVWFCFLYLLIGYLKKYRKKIRFNKWIGFAFAILIYICLLCFYFGTEYFMNQSDGFYRLAESLDLKMYFITRYHTLPAFICSFMIFWFFVNMNLRENQIINNLSKGVFAVYIIHQTPAFAAFMWEKIIMVDKWMNSLYYPIWFLLAVMGIFLSCSLIDCLRRLTFEKLIVSSKLYTKTCEKWNKFFEDIFISYKIKDEVTEIAKKYKQTKYK